MISDFARREVGPKKYQVMRCFNERFKLLISYQMTKHQVTCMIWLQVSTLEFTGGTYTGTMVKISKTSGPWHNGSAL
jgi:hypothetical protein